MVKPPLKLCVLWIIYRNGNTATTYQIRQEIDGLYSSQSISKAVNRMLKEGTLIRKYHATYTIPDNYLPAVEEIAGMLTRVFS